MGASFDKSFTGALRHIGLPLLAVTLLAATLTGCTGNDEPTAPPAVEGEPGMKFYVGGPILNEDRYGRMRLGGFNGEIQTPTSRGLLIGYKQNDDKTFVFRSWLNGVPIMRSEGFVDDDGLLWYVERVNYDQEGRVVARQQFTYDDEKEIMTSRIEHLDPDDGEVIKTFEQEIPYTPAEAEDEDWEDLDRPEPQ